MKNGNAGKFPYLVSIALIGAAAIATQVLLFREIVNFFSGNELVYGLSIFAWLILCAIGSFSLGKYSANIKDKLFCLITAQSFIALLLPAEIFMIRALKHPGPTADILTALLGIVIMLAPAAITLGFLFSLSSSLLTGIFKKDRSPINRVYIAESIGSILGGALLTYILLFFLNAFYISAVLAALTAIALIGLGLASSRKSPLFLGGILTLIAVSIFIYANFLNFYSEQLGWKGYQLLQTTDSPYGRISVIGDHETYNFFENRQLVFSTADQLSDEEAAHFPLLQHPSSKNILLIGGGVSGVTKELLKYPIDKLDYVDLDHKIIEMAKSLIPVDQRLNIRAMDGVKHLKDTGERYDLIIINLPDPANAQLNRFYTLDFFALCKNRLTANGVLSLKLETSDSYIGRELKLLNQTVYKTLSQAFKNTLVLPGNFNYFFASEAPLNGDPSVLVKRWQERNIPTEYFTADTIRSLLWPDKVQYINDAIRFDESTPLNTNLRPISYYLELLLWTSYFPSPLKNSLYAMMKFNFLFIAAGLIVLFILLKLLSLNFKRLSVPIIIALIGFCGMSVQMVIIYTFQSLHGYIYQTIGLLTTAFMAGLAMGSYFIYKRITKIKDPINMLRWSILFLVIVIISVLLMVRTIPLLLVSFGIALPIGAAFPLAVKIQKKYRLETGHLAGMLYGADLFGGALAAILTTVYLIPIFGVINTLLVSLMFGIAAVVFLL